MSRSDKQKSSQSASKQAQQSSRPSPVLLIFMIIPLLGIVAALVMLATEYQAPASAGLPSIESDDSPSLLNYQAPYFELSDLDGNTITLSDYEGQPLFLNFWQTNCPPCVRELPAFADFVAERADGIGLLAINFDETSQQVRDFLSENALEGLPVALDPDSSVRRSYGISAIPTTFVIDAEGVVRFMKLGEMTPEDMDAYVEALQAS